MARFFVAASNIFGGIAYLNGKDLDHIKALRIRDGEEFTVCDGDGTDYSCVLSMVDGQSAQARILETAPSRGEPTVQCTVYAAYSKGDKLEHVVQKAVELGASAVVLFPCRRCVSRPEGAALIKKTARLEKIAEEAAKQCGRGRIPRVSTVPDFQTAIKAASSAELPLFCYEDERHTLLKQAIEGCGEIKTASVVTGPEGGFEPEEAELACSLGMISVTMGPRILRCETAPLCALTAVMYSTGNL